MTKFMKTLTFAAIVFSTLSHSQSFSPDNKIIDLDRHEILINRSSKATINRLFNLPVMDVAMAGRLTNCVKPHYRSGTYVSGHWRS